MAEPKSTITPSQVATVFESVFVDKMCVEPSKIGLDKNTYTEVGMDSLDTLEVVMELERKFRVKISDKQASLLYRTSLYNFLNVFVKVLVEYNYLTNPDASIVMTQYAKLLRQKTDKIVNDPQNPAMTAPKSLLEEYQKSLKHTQELEKQIKQYQK